MGLAASARGPGGSDWFRRAARLRPVRIDRTRCSRCTKLAHVTPEICSTIRAMVRLVSNCCASRTGFAGRLGQPWCPQMESNHRPHAYQACALPLSYVGLHKGAVGRADLAKKGMVAQGFRVTGGKPPPSPAKSKPADERRQRQTSALRSNLHRRKEHTRNRQDEVATPRRNTLLRPDRQTQE